MPGTVVRLLDGLTLLLLAGGALVAIAGGIVVGTVLPVGDARPLLCAAAALAMIRNVAVPSPTLAASLRTARTWLGERPALDSALRLTVATRLTILAVGFVAVVTIGLARDPGFILTSDPLRNLPGRYDAGWYGGIAEHGYDRDANIARQRNIAFFPAMPMLMRAAAPLMGATDRTIPRGRAMALTLWGGVVISIGAFFWAIWYLMRLGTDLVGRERAAAGALLLACYPFAVYFSAPYSESLFLLAAVGALYHMRRDQLAAAAAWGVIAGLTRPNGCVLSIPLAFVAWQEPRTLPSPASRLALRAVVAAAPALGMLAFTAYLYSFTGLWFAWARSHEAWGRGAAGVSAIAAGFRALNHTGLHQLVIDNPYAVLNTVAGLFALALVWPVFRHVGLPYGLFVLVNLIPAVISGGALSVGRLTSTLFPIFLALGVLVSSRATPFWAAAFAIGQGLAAALFFTWRPLY